MAASLTCELHKVQRHFETDFAAARSSCCTPSYPLCELGFKNLLPPLTLRLVIHQIFLGPPDVYTRPAAVPSAEPIIEPAFPRRPSLTPNASRFSIRRGSSSFSRLSYGIHEEAELDDVKQILEGKQEDSIVGAMFGHGAFDQVKSSWWL